MRTAFRRLSSAALPLVLAGCGSLHAVEGRDDNAVFPTGRIVAPISGGTVQEENPEDLQPRTRGIFGIEIAGDYADGDFRERNGGTQAEFDMWQASVAARGGLVVANRLRLEGLAGLGWHDATVDFTNNTGPTSLDESRLGILVGLHVGWEPIDRFELYGRATSLALPFDGTSSMAEAGVSFRVSREFRVLVGYRHWRYRLEDVTLLTREDADIRANGILIGAEIRF